MVERWSESSELTLAVEGSTALVPCVSLTLYLDHDDSCGFLDFYRRAREALGPLLTHFGTASMKHRSRLNARAESMVPAWIEKRSREKHCIIQFSGCDDASGVTAASMELRMSWWGPLTEARRERGRANCARFTRRGLICSGPG